MFTFDRGAADEANSLDNMVSEPARFNSVTWEHIEVDVRALLVILGATPAHVMVIPRWAAFVSADDPPLPASVCVFVFVENDIMSEVADDSLGDIKKKAPKKIAFYHCLSTSIDPPPEWRTVTKTTKKKGKVTETVSVPGDYQYKDIDPGDSNADEKLLKTLLDNMLSDDVLRVKLGRVKEGLFSQDPFHIESVNNEEALGKYLTRAKDCRMDVLNAMEKKGYLKPDYKKGRFPYFFLSSDLI